MNGTAKALSVRSLSVVLLTASTSFGQDATPAPSGSEPALSTESGASATPRKRRWRTKRDRGEMAMQLGEIEWTGSARAKLKNGNLKLSGSNGQKIGTAWVSQSIELNIKDYSGPGDYTVPRHPLLPSLFLTVGFDESTIEASDDAGVNKAAIETLRKAKMIHLAGTKVTIESADDRQIIGTFSFKEGDPSITSGKFRAVMSKPKNRATDGD